MLAWSLWRRDDRAEQVLDDHGLLVRLIGDGETAAFEVALGRGVEDPPGAAVMSEMSSEGAAAGERIAIVPWMRVSAALFAVAWGGNEFTPLLVMYRQIDQMSALSVNVLLGAYVLGIVPALLLGGPLSDRYGRRPLLHPRPDHRDCGGQHAPRRRGFLNADPVRRAGAVGYRAGARDGSRHELGERALRASVHDPRRRRPWRLTRCTRTDVRVRAGRRIRSNTWQITCTSSSYVLLVEAGNTGIKNTTKRTGRGFRNAENYRTRILLTSAARTVA